MFSTLDHSQLATFLRQFEWTAGPRNDSSKWLCFEFFHSFFRCVIPWSRKVIHLLAIPFWHVLPQLIRLAIFGACWRPMCTVLQFVCFSTSKVMCCARPFVWSREFGGYWFACRSDQQLPCLLRDHPWQRRLKSSSTADKRAYRRYYVKEVCASHSSAHRL